MSKRPLGAIVLGAYIDRKGRRDGLILTLGLMAVGTLAIAVTPGYATIGLAAPLMVVVGRLRTNTWETPEGERRSKVEIEAEEIGPSLKWATAKVEKQGRAPGAGDFAAGVAVGAGGPQEETPLDA